MVVDWDLEEISVCAHDLCLLLYGHSYSDIGVVLAAVAGNGGLVRRTGLSGARAGDDDLGALGIELRRVGLMQGDQLVADQVVSWGKSLRDLAVPRLVAAHQLGNRPARGPLGVEEDRLAVSAEATLVDLEPASPRTVA